MDNATTPNKQCTDEWFKKFSKDYENKQLTQREYQAKLDMFSISDAPQIIRECAIAVLIRYYNSINAEVVAFDSFLDAYKGEKLGTS